MNPPHFYYPLPWVPIFRVNPDLLEEGLNDPLFCCRVRGFYLFFKLFNHFEDLVSRNLKTPLDCLGFFEPLGIDCTSLEHESLKCFEENFFVVSTACLPSV
jgi:hypothetical protein